MFGVISPRGVDTVARYLYLYTCQQDEPTGGPMKTKPAPYERHSIEIDGQSYYSAAAGTDIASLDTMVAIYREINPDSEIRVVTVRYSNFNRYSIADTVEIVGSVIR